MKTKLSELVLPLKAIQVGRDQEFEKVSIDSRTVNKGELFIAIKGENFDGHDYLAQAETNGAIAAVVEKDLTTKLPLLKVKNTRLALAEMAALRRQKFQLPIIAHTGSCGKTTVKEMMRSILANCGNVLANEGSYNNDFGVPLTLLQLTAKHQYAVIEMGANHPGEIAYLTQIAKPHVAFINNIAPAHLEGFGSLEGVARAKSEIFAGLDANGIAIINADDPFADFIKQQIKHKTILYFGIQAKKADVTASEIETDAKGCCNFVIKTPKGSVAVKLPVFGRHNVLNALAAAAAAQAVGASLEAIKAGLETMPPVKGRLMLKPGYKGSRIFDDTYNANPGSMSAALKVLAQYSGERIFIMGDMVELGPQTEEYHRSMGVLAKELGIQHLFAYGPLSRAAAKAFGASGHAFDSQTELSDAVKKLLQADTVVLIKGSRKTKMENVVNQLIVSKEK